MSEPTRDGPSQSVPTAGTSLAQATPDASSQTGEPVRAPSPPEPPTGLEGYELLAVVGQGGMGTVYRARDLRLNRDVAVKLLQDKYAPNSLAARRFVDEARITGQLQHPGIPPVHEVGELPDGRPFLVMKLIKGDTLADILASRERQRPEDAANRGTLVAAFEQVCQAVAYAHDHGVVHRDLKPHNVMVGKFGEVQVMDWGLAKFRADARAESDEAATASTFRDPREDTDEGLKTKTGSFLGTPAYMPPEQAIGAVDQIDGRSDVFGLGAILCVILTGQPPFVAGTRESTRQLAAEKKLGDAFARLDDCSAEPELVALCKRCLAPDRSERPRNAGEVAAAVHAFRAEAEERARRAELDRVRAVLQAAEQRKRRRLQLVLAAVVVVLVGAVATGAWLNEKRQAERSAAELKAGNARERAESLLSLATGLRKEYRFTAAADALRQAGELADQFAPDLAATVGQAKADFAFVVELDAIRMKRSTWIADGIWKGHFDEATAPPAYRAAFAARGLDVAADPAAVGERVSASAVREELVKALDDWAILEKDEAVRDKVLATLRRADGDSGAAPFRDPAVWADKARLQALAAKANVARLPPGAVVVIAELMAQWGLDPAPLLRHAMSLHPREFLIAFALGQVLDVKDPERLGAYRAARAIRPDNAIVLNNLGASLMASGDLPGAIAADREAIKIDPNYSAVHYNLGLALSESGDRPGAIAAYREAIRLDPKYAMTYSNLGNALQASGDLPGAIAAHKEAARLDPNSALVLSNLGSALYSSRDLPGAIAACKEAIRLDPTYVQARSNLGIALRAAGDLPGAVAALKVAVRLDPNLTAAHYNLGIALYDSRDFPGAIAALKEAIRLDPKIPQLHTNLGAALLANGDVSGAVAAFQEAVRLDPKHAIALSNLGAICFQQKKYPEAIAHARAAIDADPNYSKAHAVLGLALQQAGDIPGARAALTEAARLDKGWTGMLAKLPPLDVAPPPREKPPG